jgi:predicted Rossmann-fold nucleotide-binding protein
MHAKPVGLLDVEGFWQPLVALVEHLVREGFVPEDQRALLLVERDPAALLAKMNTWTPPVLGPKWIDVEQT